MTIIKTNKLKVLFYCLILTAISYLFFSIIYNYLNFGIVPAIHTRYINAPHYFMLLFSPIIFILASVSNLFLIYNFLILDNLKIILKPTGIDNHSTIYPKNNRFIKWQDIDHFEKDISNNTIYGVKKNSEVFTIFLGMSAGKVLDNANKIYEYYQKYQNSNQNRL